MTSRRTFLTRATAAAGSLALPSLAAAATPGAPVTADWDLSWVDRVRGTYRGVFDTAEIADGLGLVRAAIWPKQLQEVYGAAPGDITAVLVLRHNAIHFIMDDSYWARFGIGKMVGLKDERTGKWAARNILSTPPSWVPPELADVTLDGFRAGGGIVLACHLAFLDVISIYESKGKLTPEAAERAAREHVLPGIILQPSGFFAVLRAQQAGCGYMLAG